MPFRSLRPSVSRVSRVAVVGLVAAVGGAGLSLLTASPASAAVPPLVQRSGSAVTADPLPTAQVNGVVWSVGVRGNTVYAGGQFSTVRPAGSAAGTNETTRTNLFAFDIRTGTFNPGFAGTTNGAVKGVAFSPDGTKVFVVGNFSKANGTYRSYIAAFDSHSGALITTFNPSVNGPVNAIAVGTASLYIGGSFSTVNGVSRARVAALNIANGALRDWKADTDAPVRALTLTPDKTGLVVGGQFTTINGSSQNGVAAVDSHTGTVRTWLVNRTVKVGGYRVEGGNSSVTSLRADGDTVYGTTYSYGSPAGNFEGTFAARPSDGAVVWLADCHGDSYDSASMNGIVYTVSHAHFCANVGGFPEYSPQRFSRAMAFTKGVGGTVQRNGQTGGHYVSFEGQPAPSITSWYPDLTIGTYTGQSQAAWSAVGNGTYLVLGGEFPRVNGVNQQGLVRFGIPSVAPNKAGPLYTGSSFPLTASRSSGSSVKLSWQSNYDRDDQNLTYRVYRGTTLVTTLTKASWWWNRPGMTFTDTGTRGSTSYSYVVRVSDASGNTKVSSTATLTTGSAAAQAKQVQGEEGDAAVPSTSSAPSATPTEAAPPSDPSASPDPSASAPAEASGTSSVPGTPVADG